ncbi:MAG: flagellar filament capping protein FliD [Rickettsiales bacterium]
MVTQIQLGNFFNSGGRTVLGGVGGSGLDTQTLIEGLAEAKRIPAVRLEDRIALNQSKVTALTEFRGLLSNLKDAMNFLRNPPGVGNAVDNVFRYTTSSISSSTSDVASTYLSVSTSPGATIQEYTISEITSVAKAKKQSSNLFAIANADTSVVSSTPGAGEFGAGTFILAGESITFNVDDSLNTVAAKFNAVSAATGISASVIKIGDNSFQLSFTSTASGEDADFDFNNVDVADTLDDTADSVFDQITITTQQAASNAEFKFNGQDVVRQNNAVGDIVAGVTFNILQISPVGPPAPDFTISIKPDEEIATSGIINFLNAYNDIKIFATEQSQVGVDGTFTEESVLSNSTALRSSLNAITAQLSTVVAGIVGSDLNRLADIGIVSADLPETVDNPLVRNILNIDEDKLSQALANNFDGVRKLFEFDFVSDNPNLRVFKRTNAFDANNFSVELNPYAVQTTKIYEIVDADTAVVADDPDGNEIQSGSVVINSIAIDFVEGDSLNDIAQKFNDVQASTGVTAEVVEEEPNKFRLKFTSIVNGVETNLLSPNVNPNGVFTGAGITSQGTFQATYDDGEGPVTVDLAATFITESDGTRSGISLTGPDGTPLEGLQLIYAGTQSTTIQATATQGIADLIFNTAADILDDSGPLEAEIDALETAETRFEADIARIDAEIERYTQSLLEKFSALEQAVSRVNLLLQSIDADTQARNNA